MSKARRIAIRDFTGKVVKTIDISDLDHANTRCPMYAEVQVWCDEQEWHTRQKMELVPWGQRIRKGCPYRSDGQECGYQHD